MYLQELLAAPEDLPDPIFDAIKAATMKQLTAIQAFVCSKGGFPTVNRHLNADELAGLGWRDLQPLCANPEQGEEALTASLAALVCNLAHVQFADSSECVL